MEHSRVHAQFHRNWNKTFAYPGRESNSRPPPFEAITQTGWLRQSSNLFLSLSVYLATSPLLASC